jgi:hypothetical protein
VNATTARTAIGRFRLIAKSTAASTTVRMPQVADGTIA